MVIFIAEYQIQLLRFLEERVAALEGGTAALATSSGMSAIFLAVMTLCEAGDHLVVSSQLYGGTVNLFRLNFAKIWNKMYIC